MPKETFLKLSKEKQEKIIKSAKKEFARVPMQEVSIKNIVETAEIARGSFYQYFESKEDLLIYIIDYDIKNINTDIETRIRQLNGDIFDTYISVYDFMVENFVEKEERQLYKQIFENIKSSDENIFKKIKKYRKPMELEYYYDLIDKSNLKIVNKEQFDIICEMLDMITRKAIIKSFKSNSKEKAKEEFLMKINYLKYGVLKGGKKC